MNGNAYIHYKHDYFLRKDFLKANLGVAKKSVTLGHSKKQKQILWIQFHSFKQADCFELIIYNISFIIFKKILLLEGINNNNEIPSSGKTNSIKRIFSEINSIYKTFYRI